MHLGKSGFERKDDAMIINWANQRIKQLTPQQNIEKMRLEEEKGPYTYSYTNMRTFRDKHLKDSLYFLHLLWAIEPKYVDWDVVSDREEILNAR